jgi:hypothetical protein
VPEVSRDVLDHISFRDELIWLLKNHGIEFDEKYIQ